MRTAERRHGSVLGKKHRGSVDDAVGGFLVHRRWHGSHLRTAERRHGSVLGKQQSWSVNAAGRIYARSNGSPNTYAYSHDSARDNA